MGKTEEAIPATPSPADGLAPAPPPPQEVVVRPEYPGWFRPLAEFVESSPVGALVTLAAAILALYGAGFVTALALR